MNSQMHPSNRLPENPNRIHCKDCRKMKSEQGEKKKTLPKQGPGGTT